MSTVTLPEFAPGSEPAIQNGCKCAVIDNGHGRGYMGQQGIFVITAGCPIHALPDRSFVIVPAFAPNTTDTEE